MPKERHKPDTCRYLLNLASAAAADGAGGRAVVYGV